MTTLVAEALFAVIFARTLLLYLRDRDPLQGVVALIFLPPMAVLLNAVLRQVFGPLPVVLAALPAILLLAQPYLTLRLAACLRAVPWWLDRTLLAVLILGAVPLAMAPRPLPVKLLACLTLSFVITETIAAVFLLRGAQRRTGAARARLWLTALATQLFAVMMVLLGLSALLYTSTTNWLSTTARVITAVSAIMYMIAFMPPDWLRRIMSATIWYQASEQLQRLSATATADEVWRRYLTIVCTAAGAEAAVLLKGTEQGGVAELAAVGLSGDPPTGYTSADLDRLVEASGGRLPIEVPGISEPKAPAAAASRPRNTLGRARATEGPPLAAHYARAAVARYVTVLPLRLPGGERGAVLLLDRYRALFSADDTRLVAVLGGQAGVLAERSGILADQRHLTERLAASVQALTNASQAKSDFLAGMSHELRTPLNAIIGFSDLMRAEAPDGDRRSVPAEWVDHVHGSGRHLLGLINDILDLAKVEAGRLELHPEPLWLDRAVMDLVTGLRPLTERKRLVVQQRVPHLLGLADPLRFRQILDNLLSNAIKFTPEHGRIEVSAEPVSGGIAITVADTGIGIAARDHTRVFEEFQQLGDPVQRKAGTGLGLALTRRLVEAHGGSIELESELGQGSRFTIRLPDAIGETPSVESTEAARAEHPGERRGRVLIIDDDARSTELLCTYLTGAGYEVSMAGGGEIGLAAARRLRPDAILLDVLMPDMDGWTVIQALKRDEGLRDVPVFFVTILDDRRTGITLGATDYFVKPIDHDALLAQLARHVLPQDLSDTDRMRPTGKVVGTVPGDTATADGPREWMDLAGIGKSTHTLRRGGVRRERADMSRVLLVEDEELNRVLVRAILARSKDDAVHEVELLEAEDLATARLALSAAHVDVVLLDVNLPDGNGLSLASDLITRPDRPRVIALTASVLPHERAAAMSAGCDAFLDKPYAAQELVDMLAAHLPAN